MKQLLDLLNQWAELTPAECEKHEDGMLMVDAEAIGVTSVEFYPDSCIEEFAMEFALILPIVQYFIAKRGWLFSLRYEGGHRYAAKVLRTAESHPHRYYSDNPTVAILAAYVDVLKGQST